MFEIIQIGWGVIIPIILVLVILLIVIIWKGIAGHKVKVTTGEEGIVGEIGKVSEKIDPQGKIIVHGEIWRAKSTQVIEKGEEAKVVAVDRNLVVEVEKV
ncbi:hypothetical protein JXI42_12540 [bacterium]|nr:hypothetical protein [bacterium]